jgi:GntR family transcriptional repressor for pyruvate dehydrogenase complex
LHLAIARATHNDTFFRICEPVLIMLEEFRERSMEISGRMKEVVAEHKKILQAIKNGDDEQAEKVMIMHILKVEEMIRGIKGEK